MLDHNNIFEKQKPHKNLPFWVHWADHSQEIKSIQKMIKDGEVPKSVEACMSFIESLKQKFWWIKTEVGRLPVSIFSLYESAVKNTQSGDFEDQLYNVTEISETGPMGPYEEVCLIEKLSEQYFQAMVYYKLLKNSLPARRKRFICNQKILVKYGKGYETDVFMRLVQITPVGLLFKVKDELFFDKAVEEPLLKLYFNTNHFHAFINDNYHDLSHLKDKLFYTNNDLNYHLVATEDIKGSLQFDPLVKGEYFVFIRFYDIQESEIDFVFKEFWQKF
jgi:hypothetical protein